MNGKDILNKLAEILQPKAEVVEVKLAYAKLEDGTIITAPEFAVDQVIEIVSEDGSKAPMENGDYKIMIEDKMIDIKVLDGKISEMVEMPVEEAPVETPEVEVEVEQPEVEVPTEEAPVMDEKDVKIAELEIKIKELQDELALKMETENAELSKVKDEELPKLDGAPIEENNKLFVKANKIADTPENRFLTRLYGTKK